MSEESTEPPSKRIKCTTSTQVRYTRLTDDSFAPVTRSAQDIHNDSVRKALKRQHEDSSAIDELMAEAAIEIGCEVHDPHHDSLEPEPESNNEKEEQDEEYEDEPESVLERLMSNCRDTFASLISSRHTVRRTHQQSRRQRIQQCHQDWTRELPALVQEYIVCAASSSHLAFTTASAKTSESTSNLKGDSEASSSQYPTRVIGVREYVKIELITQLQGEGANTSLIRRGLLGSAPNQPTVSFTLELLELYHQLRRRQSNFSVQAFAKVICSLHNKPFTNVFRQHFSDAFDAYLNILHHVKARVDITLQRSDKDWRAKNACPACSFKCPDEPNLKYTRLHAMDGNNSLKRFEGKRSADDRIFESSYFLSNEYVDLFKDDVHNAKKTAPAPPPTTTPSTSQPTQPTPTAPLTPLLAPTIPIRLLSTQKSEGVECADTWHAASSVSEDTVKVFDQTGIFLSTCRHAIVEFVVEMRKSGELAKYGLAVADKTMDMYGKGQLKGYDIGCHFEKTTQRSSIGQKAEDLNLQFVVDAFHGHAHNRRCQLKFHPLYRDGIGLEDFGACERIFSSSNSVARLTRHTSYYHWKQFIDLHFTQWDEDRYEDLSKFLFNNYKQALLIISTYTPIVDDLKKQLKISDNDFLRWNHEEEEYLIGLSKKDKFNPDAISYVTKLAALALLEAAYEAAQKVPLFHSLTPSDYQLSGQLSPAQVVAEKKAREAARARDKLRDSLSLQRDAVYQIEAFLGIARRWKKTDPDYQEVAEYIESSKFVVAVEKVEGLVVQRLMELAKANLAETGYKQRKHISKALTKRSAAIRTAIKKYNELATLQSPSPPQLDIETVLSYSLLGEFDLLKISRVDILSKPWSKSRNRETASKYFKICRAHEELARLNVEIARLEAWVQFEEKHFQNTLTSLRITEPSLAVQVQHLYDRRHRVNAKHCQVMQDIYSLPGYTGLVPTLTESPTIDTIEGNDDAGVGDDVEVGDDDGMVDEAIRLRDFVESITA